MRLSLSLPLVAFAPSSPPFERARRRLPGPGAWHGRPRPAVRVSRFLGLLSLWRERARSRRLLATFDDRMLADIGVERATAVYEVDKPFWRG
ncbi:MAG TPA: DUF1127 domain-containing protein [Stellaceae bacterium]|nr:DUF1127 domain-containing protein [Stellaceae bacterium]